MISRRSILRASAGGLLLPRRAFAWRNGKVPAASGQFVIRLTFDSSTSGAPTDFFTAAQAAATQLGQLIYLTKTVDITVQWGANTGPAGNQISTGLISASQYFIQGPVAYSTVRSQLISNAKSANAIAAVATLPASAPTGATDGIWLSYPMANAQYAQAHSPPYAWAGFASTQNWSYSGTPGVTALDFNEAALHEFTECLGRFSAPGTILPGSFPNACGVQDLYVWSGAGTRNITSSGTHYFSIDSGTTNQRSMGAGDPGDWSGGGLYSASPSPFDGLNPPRGQLIPLLPCDTLLIDVLGYSSQ